MFCIYRPSRASRVSDVIPPVLGLRAADDAHRISKVKEIIDYVVILIALHPGPLAIRGTHLRGGGLVSFGSDGCFIRLVGIMIRLHSAMVSSGEDAIAALVIEEIGVREVRGWGGVGDLDGNRSGVESREEGRVRVGALRIAVVVVVVVVVVVDDAVFTMEAAIKGYGGDCRHRVRLGWTRFKRFF